MNRNPETELEGVDAAYERGFIDGYGTRYREGRTPPVGATKTERYVRGRWEGYQARLDDMEAVREGDRRARERLRVAGAYAPARPWVRSEVVVPWDSWERERSTMLALSAGGKWPIVSGDGEENLPRPSRPPGGKRRGNHG